jgi:hypothetical protein
MDIQYPEHLAAGFARLAAAEDSAGQPTADLPFDEYLRQQPEKNGALKKLLDSTWNAPGQEWRKIDADWATAAEAVALALDKHTNNTSLALAFEMTASGKVLLFPGDAQVGNWLSWHEREWRIGKGPAEQVVKGPALLARTVFYKVAHHGSHNATLRDKGLELMTHPDLVAFIPVRVAEARKNRWFEMPFVKLVGRLKEKTRGRVVLSDPDCPPPSDEELTALTTVEKQAFRAALTAEGSGLYYDYFLEGP